MLERFAEFISYKIVGIAPETKLADAVVFFIADTIKIFLLLIIIIFIVSIVRSYLPPDKIRKMLAGKNTFVASVLAALLGVITPFCTCSAIPLFLGFVEAGVPVGATFSFLISSPMVNEIALILLLGTFGWKIALLYAGFGLFLAILSGMFLGKIKAEKWISQIETKSLPSRDGRMEFRNRIVYAVKYTKNIVKKVWFYIVIGIAVGSFMHGYVPVNFLSNIASESNWYAVPVAVILGVPLYSNAAGIVPLISVLTEKGVAIGTVLAFMMAVTGLSLPEFLILKKILKWPLLVTFFVTIAIGIIVLGYLFNFII